MHRKLSVILLVLTTIGFTALARANHDGFHYSIEDVNIQLAPLDKLEQLRIMYPEKTFHELVSDQELATYTFSEVSNLQNGFSEPMPILPAFWWGCFLGWVGILVVFLVTQDSTQTQSALWGCIVNGLFGCLIYSLLVLNFGIGTSFYFWFW